jgi:hypothetical protein
MIDGVSCPLLHDHGDLEARRAIVMIADVVRGRIGPTDDPEEMQ